MTPPFSDEGPRLVLSLFPGIGLLDMAFEEEGFCVVRGPDLLWGGDVRKFHPPAGRFDGVIGGPPCQAFSRLRFLVEHNGYEVAANLIPEYERIVAAAAPRWFLMENVPEAPAPAVLGYATRSVRLNNRWVGGVQNRLRAFTFGTAPGFDGWRFDPAPDLVALEQAEWEPAVLAASGGRSRPVRLGGTGKPKRTGGEIAKRRSSSWRDAARLQGLPGDFDLPPFTSEAKMRAIGNGVPLPLGRAVARAVKRALVRSEAA